MWPIFILSGVSAYLLSGCERRNNNSPETTISPSARPYVPPAIPSSFRAVSTEAFVPRNQSHQPATTLRDFQGVTLTPYVTAQYDLNGSPSVGTILFLRQAHRSLDGNMSPAAITSQWDLFRYLRDIARPRTIFWESLSENYDRQRLNAWIEDHVSTSERASLDRLRQNPNIQDTDTQLQQLVARLSAAFVYGYVSQREDLLLHRVMTLDEAQRQESVVRLQLDCMNNNDSFERLRCLREQEPFLMQERERWATREISNYFSSHPGETIVLIYGAAHTFCDDFSRSRAPKIVSIWSLAAMGRLSGSRVCW